MNPINILDYFSEVLRKAVHSGTVNIAAVRPRRGKSAPPALSHHPQERKSPQDLQQSTLQTGSDLTEDPHHRKGHDRDNARLIPKTSHNKVNNYSDSDNETVWNNPKIVIQQPSVEMAAELDRRRSAEVRGVPWRPVQRDDSMSSWTSSHSSVTDYPSESSTDEDVRHVIQVTILVLQAIKKLHYHM